VSIWKERAALFVSADEHLSASSGHIEVGGDLIIGAKADDALQFGFEDVDVFDGHLLSPKRGRPKAARVGRPQGRYLTTLLIKGD